jgi:uncharacterized surface protein with fasciclin (FAS1) repeats
MKNVFVLLILMVVVFGVSARAEREVTPEEQSQPGQSDTMEMADTEEMEAASIVDIAAGDERFETLVTALQEAGLVDTLAGDGPFTVFAPTDEAFEALPEGTLDALLGDMEALTQVLTYHVVSGSVTAEQVASLSNAETLQGQPVVVNSSSGVAINNAQVVQADVMASNGVIHVIDSVLVPPTADIVELAVSAGSFSTLVAAVEAAGLADTLRGEGPFTVFAPTDEAFAKLPEGTIEALLDDIPTLSRILTYHVVPNRVFSGDVAGLASATTVQGQAIDISTDGTSVKLNGTATVLATDALATNGVIHAIDTVIMPE